MPVNVRLVVSRLVDLAQLQPRAVADRPNGFPLTGGPAGCSYLDADGEVWDFSFCDDSVHPVEDGPRKVGLLAIAAERVPELAAWLPRRPATARNCLLCKQSATLQPPLPPVQCPDCSGMGWLPE
jgi:hypothetical protein